MDALPQLANLTSPSPHVPQLNGTGRGVRSQSQKRIGNSERRERTSPVARTLRRYTHLHPPHAHSATPAWVSYISAFVCFPQDLRSSTDTISALVFNASGQKDYPWPTSHIDRKSLPNVPATPRRPANSTHLIATAVIFDKSQRHLIVLSDIGLLIMGLLVKAACDSWGAATVFKLYGIPWLLVSHWLVTVTYLHHTDPVVPHYRGKAWTYARGAASTVDRDFLGWQGYFFLHGISHYHVIHHFFPRMPHCKLYRCWDVHVTHVLSLLDHGKEATQYLKSFLGEHYHHSEVPVFQALWQNYNACQFVEDEGTSLRQLKSLRHRSDLILLGDVLFYRDKQGNSVAQAAETTS